MHAADLDLDDYYNLLKEAGILTDETRAILASSPRYADELALGLVVLAKANLLNPEYTKVLTASDKYAHDAAKAISCLHGTGLLNSNNLKAIQAAKRYVPPHLRAAGINTVEERDEEGPWSAEKIFCSAIVVLEKAHCLNDENLSLLKEDKKTALALAHGLTALSEANLLSAEYSKLLAAKANRQNAWKLADGLAALHKAGLATQKNMSELLNNKQNARSLAAALIYMNENGLLNEQNFSHIVKNSQYGIVLVNGLTTLKNANVTDPELVELLCQHPKKAIDFADCALVIRSSGAFKKYPIELISKLFIDPVELQKLSPLGLLNLQNLEWIAIAKHQNKFSLTLRNLYLYKKSLLTPALCSILAAYSGFSNQLLEGFIALDKAGRLNAEAPLASSIDSYSIASRNFAVFLLKLLSQNLINTKQHNDNLARLRDLCLNLATSFNALVASGVLNHSSFEIIWKWYDLLSTHDAFYHRTLSSLDRLLVHMDRVHILNQSNLMGLLSYAKHLSSLDTNVGILNGLGLLNQENYNKLLAVIAYLPAISLVNAAGLLNQANFDRLCLYAERMNRTLINMPPGLLNQVHLDHIFGLCENAANSNIARANVLGYVNLLLLQFNRPADAGVGAVPAPLFNNAQSTHTSSVHRSIGRSVRSLREYYMLSPENAYNSLEELKSWMRSLPGDNEKNRAAKAAFARILLTAREYREPISYTNFEVLLALIWKAMHDEENRLCELEEAKSSLLEGLYEVQRGYNLDEKGKDIGGEDKPICTGGTFNKLVEKLVGIHTMVVIEFVTMETASLKLPIVVNEEANLYLNEHPEELIENQSEIIPNIWDKIKNKVADRMFDEYGSLYPRGKQDPGFIGLIEAGESTDFKIDPKLAQDSSELSTGGSGGAAAGQSVAAQAVFAPVRGGSGGAAAGQAAPSP
ncbi:MAG: uncharacterized protein K0R66_476 [Gammaproteobacteria bacterium]|nr:uncharacterized protein [Gammaproteobacteria bacterium]